MIDPTDLNLRVWGAIRLPPRPERLLPVPENILEGWAGKGLLQRRDDGKLWAHQVEALECLERGEHTVVATSTASGKSLIFQARTIDTIGRNPGATAIVFNPLRALAEDQLGSWKDMAEQCGMDPECIVKIDGSIAMGRREEMLEQASVAIVTPDICQAWIMRNTSSRVIQEFVQSMKVMVIDEAHVYDSVFGSNAGYLFRRLLNVRDEWADNKDGACQIIAATATISNAAEHMRRLTGRPFSEIGEDRNGAAVHEREVLHIDGNGEDEVAEIIQTVVAKPGCPKFIAFIDSRQGVERVARRVRGGRVLAYRNGYESRDRREIETALRDGNLNGVVSTSALELGINIPGLSLGMNLKLPGTRKAFRQRLGRVGRDGPGTFMIVGPPNLFSQYGETMQQYYEASAEPSVLYLDNRYIQFANAQCFTRESAQQPDELDEEIWPRGFDKAVRHAGRGTWPEEYEGIARAGRRMPHLAHAIRTLPGPEIHLIDDDTGKRIGSTTLDNAMRENYPGAAYLHAGRRYKTGEWEQSGQHGSIEIAMSEYSLPESTEPQELRDVTVDKIVDGHLIMHRDGKSYLAEVYTSINKKVTGYTCNGRLIPYEKDAIPERDFDTTGVLLRIEEEWVAWAQLREQIGMMLEAITRYNCSIANWDVDHTDEAITIRSRQHPDGIRTNNAILVYDDTHGSLRLTEALFREFPRYMEQLKRSVELEGERLDRDTIDKLARWAGGLIWEEKADQANSETAQESAPDRAGSQKEETQE